jgi:hypothetical protein
MQTLLPWQSDYGNDQCGSLLDKSSTQATGGLRKDLHTWTIPANLVSAAILSEASHRWKAGSPFLIPENGKCYILGTPGF